MCPNIDFRWKVVKQALHFFFFFFFFFFFNLLFFFYKYPRRVFKKLYFLFDVNTCTAECVNAVNNLRHFFHAG